MLTMQKTLLTPWWSPLIFGGFFAVDSFFFLSGFLTYCLLTEKLFGKPFNFKSFVMIYIHRYVRLLFVLGFMLLFIMFMFQYLTSGPQSDTFINVLIRENCQNYWWTTLLMINNLHPWISG